MWYLIHCFSLACITILYAGCTSKKDHVLIFDEQNGMVIVEAEDFIAQSNTDIRSWVFVGKNSDFHGPNLKPEYAATTSSGAGYIICLPDTRKTHDDPLIEGENFTNVPGTIAVLHYKVRFNNAGKYYVWVRAFSTGTEDNGLHVGINGLWPESGRRMQWCDGKNEWNWESKQRTEANHCGEPGLIYLIVEEPGVHEILFSMREDGFAFDQFALSQNYVWPVQPSGNIIME